MATNDSTAQFNAVATAVANDLADGQRKIDALNEQAQRGGFAAFAAKRGFEIPRTVDESDEAEWRVKNGYESLVARAQADSPVMYRPAVVTAADMEPVKHRSAVARVQDDGFDGLGPRRYIGGLDSVERSLQTIEAYLDTLKAHLPATAQCYHDLGLESFNEFKKMLHRGEAALVRAYAPSAPAPPPSPEKAKDELGALLKVAVDEVMAEA